MLALARLVATLQRRRVEDRRPQRQPASGIARCFATQKVRENCVKVWLAAPPLMPAHILDFRFVACII